MNQIQQQFLRKIEAAIRSTVISAAHDRPDYQRHLGCQSTLVRRQSFEDAEDFAYHRFSWRVKDNLAPDARLDRALQLLASSIPLGMLVFRDLKPSLTIQPSTPLRKAS